MQNINNKTNENTLKAAEVLKTVLRLGHEAFSKGDLHSASTHILNNSRIVLKYDRACIANCTAKRSKIISISNQSEVNQNSEFTIEMTKLIKSLSHIDKITLLTDEIINHSSEYKNSEEAFKYFKNNNEKIIIVPLLKPGVESSEEKIFWVIEFFNDIQETGLNIINLLSLHYREAVWYYSIDRENVLSKLFQKKKHFSTPKVILYLVLIFIIVSFFKISQNVVADFEFIPYDEVTEYAPYAGIIENVSFRNGQKVDKGDTIFQYAIQELSYNLMEAKTQFAEISAELDWIKQQSFSDKKQLGRVKLLALQLQAKKIEIEKNQWYLDKAKITADISGVLVLNESEKWQGKAVRAGENLFEIVPPGKINAEVMLNENNASVIGKNTKITLYLHSMPESPVTGKIISVSPKPMLTKTGQFAYIIKMQLSKIKPGFIVGMRGVARVTGEKVSIGYYLFKNIVLWWRKI